MSAPPLHHAQGWMTSAIVEASEAEDVRAWLTRGPRTDAQARLEIYRLGYRARLVECLADDFPTLKGLLGEDAFEALCLAYIAEHPSSSPNLNAFGTQLPRFCLGGGRAHVVSGSDEQDTRAECAAELAELEWALVEILHAEAAPPLEKALIQAVPSDAWPGVRFVPSPALRILRFQFPVNELFTAHATEARDIRGQFPDREPNALVAYRSGTRLWRAPLSRAMLALLAPIMEGASLAEAIEALESCGPEAVEEAGPSLMLWFADWAESGFFLGLKLP